MLPDTTLRLRRVGGTWQAEGAPHCRVGAPPSALPAAQEPFAEWAWDGARLLVRNDRYGLQPMFVAAAPHSLILSTSLEGALQAGAPAHLDDAAMALLLRLGNFVGDDTPFQAVRTLPPFAAISLEDDTPRVSGGPALPERNGLSGDAALQAYVELFRQAMARRLPRGRDAVLLSGGRDSRHILFELMASGRRPSLVLTARHHPPKNNEDARVAAIVTAALGLGHEVVDQPDARVEAELRKNRVTNFVSPDMHAWYMVVRDSLAGRVEAVHDGLGGDVLSMARYLNPRDLALYRAGRLQELAERMLGREWLSRLLTPDAVSRWPRDLALDRLVRELELHAGAPNPVRSFRFWNYGRRKIGSYACGIFAGLELHLPFLDPDVFALLAGLEPEVIMAEGGHFHTRALTLGYPGLSHLPFEEAGRRTVHDRTYFARFARQTGRYLLRARLAPEVDRRAAWLRLARCAVGGGYSETVAILGPWLIYLTQLAELAAGAGPDGREGPARGGRA